MIAEIVSYIPLWFFLCLLATVLAYWYVLINSIILILAMCCYHNNRQCMCEYVKVGDLRKKSGIIFSLFVKNSFVVYMVRTAFNQPLNFNAWCNISSSIGQGT